MIYGIWWKDTDWIMGTGLVFMGLLFAAICFTIWFTGRPPKGRWPTQKRSKPKTSRPPKWDTAIVPPTASVWTWICSRCEHRDTRPDLQFCPACGKSVCIKYKGQIGLGDDGSASPSITSGSISSVVEDPDYGTPDFDNVEPFPNTYVDLGFEGKRK
jgi:hypothetical protein